MPVDATEEIVTEPRPKPGFLAEARDFLGSIPHKGVFAVIFAAWIALFHFMGNANLGYQQLTPSAFGWLNVMYRFSADDALGMYVPAVVIALIWWKRKELAAIEKRIWWPALALFAGAILLHVAGYVIQQVRVSLFAFALGLYALTGLLWGFRWMRATFFPLFLLIFAIPMGGEIELFTLPLRELAAGITVVVSRVLGIDVIREGTLMFDSAHRFQYNVEAACSGMRSLTTMTALACVFAFTSFSQTWKRLVLIVSAAPFAVLGNVMRLLTIVIAAEAAGQEAGNYVHKHGAFSLIPYVPAMIGMSLLSRWLRGGRKEKPA